jgi:hypothetical protein
MERDTEELLAAARSTARETEELVKEGAEQISGIGERLRDLKWLGEQIRQLLRFRRDSGTPDAI